ncbi:MAG: helix-turn-helix domain-containing protein [Spirochaetes bacterium]|nr:helix-turn-helix domain-containing protein [Spirochaetota bacterium]
MPRKCSICVHPERVKIDELLLHAESLRDIASRYGTSTSTLQRHKKHISGHLLRAKGDTELEYSDSLLDQLKKINENANKLLDTAMNAASEGSNANIALLAMKEIRGQLGLQLEIFKIMYDMKAVREFQEGVVRILGELDPEARDEFVRRIKEKRGIQ